VNKKKLDTKKLKTSLFGCKIKMTFLDAFSKHFNDRMLILKQYHLLYRQDEELRLP
jgi:hypothetical protein